MKYLVFKFIFLITSTIFCYSIFLWSYASAANELISQVKLFEMDRYSVQVELDKGWEVRIDKAKQHLYFEEAKKELKSYRSIQVGEKDASKIFMGSHSEKWVADNYRRFEESDMVVRGVQKDRYELQDLKKYELMINEKKFYLMTYKQILKRDLTGLTGYGYLYLYFPSNFEESSKFYIFHYFYLEPKGKQLEINLDEFHSVVNGFTLK
jgi:hypothetical protein